MLRIKKNDIVMVIAGKDKGKTGKVMRVFPARQRALVENINVVKKAKRKTQQDPQGGIRTIESPIHLSNLSLIDKQANKPSRFGTEVLKNSEKVRKTKMSGVPA